MALLLSTINTPADLRKLPPDKLTRLAAELREFIIEQCAENPGFA
jgi:1-deoxy-D-xylulose-5-phosphate synthase